MSSFSGERSSARHPWVEAGLIVAFWVCIFSLTFGREVFEARLGPPVSSYELLANVFELLVWMVATPGVFWLTNRFPLDDERWPQTVLIHLVLALVVASVVNELGHVGYRLVNPAAAPADPFGAWIELSFLNELAIYAALLAAGFARNYFYRLQDRRRKTAELEKQLAEARLEALRMQINPHFLFNTLHAISSMVEDRPREVHRMIARLSELLRYALESTASQEVPLEKEVDFLQRYLEIQQIRFEGRLDSRIDVPPRLRDALVPSLILQPIVENAIKHGASQTDRAVGRVTVSAELTGTELVLAVEDNGPGPGNDELLNGATGGIGLENTRKRLANLYGGTYSLHTRPAPETGGLKVEIGIPYHTSGERTAVTVAAN